MSRACFVLSLALLTAATAHADEAPAEPVRLLTSTAASDEGDEVARRSIELLMRRARLSYTLSHEPIERAVASFRAGHYDADILRFAQYDSIVPGAIRVDPHLLSTTIMAFTRSAELAPQSWEALRGLRVAHVRGVKLIEQRLAGAPGVEVTSRPAACLGMVAADRVDVCLLNAELGYEAPPAADGRALHRSVLARVNLHIWVAPGHQALAQRLSTALRAIVASGELARTAGANRQP